MNQRLAVLSGAALGLFVVLGALRRAPTRAVAPNEAGVRAMPGQLLPEDQGSIREVLFHYVPELEPLVADAYRDFFTALDPETRFVAVVPVGATSALNSFLARLDPTLRARTRVVEVRGPITVWSKDRGLVVGPLNDGGRTTLLVPAPPDARWRERRNDWATLPALASQQPERYFVRELPLDFDAGDFAVTGERVIVDANLFHKNEHRGIASPEALATLLRGLLGRDVLLLGRADGDVPRHHMSMYMTPLGERSALVGDPRAGLAMVGRDWTPGDLGADTDEPLRPDWSDAMLGRFDRAADELAAAGYRVERFPSVPFDDKTYIAYTNGFYETRAGRKIAYVPQYGFPPLDEAARATYARLGWEARPVRVRAAYPFHGTIGCLANILARGD